MPPVSEARRDLARQVNVEGTRILFGAARPEVPIVLASSVATYGVVGTEIVTVDHRQQPIDFYGETKLQNEADARASGRPVAILRISGIAVPALLEIPRPWFFSREQHVEFIHLSDAAQAVARCVENKAALGRILQIAGGARWRTTGEEYSRGVCGAFDLPAEEATYLPSPNWPAWYETGDSQALLDYQRHSFSDFCGELRQIYREQVG
jgi:nucleoside-diphosphate-sugar epimerase